jgi:hypothetical protein
MVRCNYYRVPTASALSRAKVRKYHMCISTRRISQITLLFRPGRIEPHAVKRRPKPHALLTVHCNIEREKISLARSDYA